MEKYAGKAVMAILETDLGAKYGIAYPIRHVLNFVYTIYVVNNDDYLLGTLSLKQLLLTASKVLTGHQYQVL